MDFKGVKGFKSEGVILSEGEKELNVELPRGVNWSKSEG